MFGFGPSAGQRLFVQFYGQTTVLTRLVVESQGIAFLRNPQQEREYRATMGVKILRLVAMLQAEDTHQGIIRRLNRAFSHKDVRRFWEFVAYLGWCRSPDEARRQGVERVKWSWWFGRPKVTLRGGLSTLAKAGALAAGYAAGQHLVKR